MSVEKRNGGYRVRWRDENGDPHGRQFTLKGDAVDFDIALKRRKQLGQTLAAELLDGGVTLDEFVRTGFRMHAVTLSEKTRRHYRWALDHHLTELADEPLRGLDVPRLMLHQSYLLDNGRTANTVREAMTRLSGILQVAVEHGQVPANAARAMRKVPLPAREDVRPLAPVELVCLIDRLEGRGRIIAMLAGYAGLRPIEIRQVRWHNLDGRMLTVSRAATKKSAARTRTFEVPAELARALPEWRMACGRPGDTEPIVGATEPAMRLWSHKHLTPTVWALTKRDDVTLYTLRHTNASMLHYCGHTVPSAAAQLGHSGQVHLGYYAHVIDALQGRAHHADLDALIAHARAQADKRRREAAK